MTVVMAIALAAGCAAVVEDLWRHRISNWTSAAALVGGVACHWAEEGWRGGMWALAGATAGFGVFLLFYVLDGMGGGDLKLMAGFGSLLGPVSILTAAWVTAVAGAGIVLLALAWRRWRPAADSDAVPYAPAIVIGAWLVLLGRV